jgi:MFS family permease
MNYIFNFLPMPHEYILWTI